ncbi:MAG: hypothetical protein AAGF67_17770 [Verrucomicrobiota bacterium]
MPVWFLMDQMTVPTRTGGLAAASLVIDVSSGGHYRSMINEGNPAAIEWIQQANP